MRTLKYSILAILIIVLSFSLYSQDLFVEKMDNGLTLIMKVVPTSTITAVRIFVKTGSMYEDSLLGCGISHYFEHIMAGGTTKKHTEDEYDALKQKWGAWYNAYTTIDHTAYYLIVPSQYSYDAMRVVSEWVVYPAFNEKEVKREKGVIQKEILMGDTPDERIWRSFLDKFVQNHPIKYPVIGYLPLFNSIKRKNILDYYYTRYTPDNTVVVVAGNYDPDSMRKVVKEVFKDYKRRPIYIPHIPDENYQDMKKTYTEYYDINKYVYYRAYHIPPITHEDIPVLRVISAYLDNEDAPLYNYIVNEKGWAKDYGTYVYTSVVGGGGFYIYIETDRKEYIDSAIVAIDNEIEKIKKEGVPSDFVENYASATKLDYLRSIQRMESLVSMYGISYIRFNDPQYYDKYYDLIKTLKKEDFISVSNKYFKDKNLTEMFALPLFDKRETALKSASSNISLHKDNIDSVDVIWENDDGSDLVDVGIIIKNMGSATDLIPGESNVLVEMIKKGSKKYNEEYLARFFKGGDLKISANIGYVSIYFTVLKDKLDKAIEIINDILTNPSMKEEDFNNVIERELYGLQTLHDDNSRYAMREFGKRVFEGTPYVNRFAADSVSYKEITIDKLKDRLNKYLKKGNIIVGLYGVNDPQKYVSELTKNIPTGKEKFSFDKNVNFNSGKEVINYKHPQVNIYIAYPAPLRNSKDYVAYETFMSFFNGNTNYLHKNLRQKNDLVYYSYGYPYTNIYPGGISLFTAQTSFDKKDKVLKIMENTIDNIIKGKFSDKELELVKQESLNQMSVWYSTRRDRMERDLYYEFEGLGYDYANKYKDDLMKVTKKDLREIAKRYFSKDPYIFITQPEEVK